jgi:hypothetical protein
VTSLHSVPRVFLTVPPPEFLQYTGILLEPDVGPAEVAIPPPVVPLLHLRSLVLHSTLCTRILLSYIHAPDLRELYLEHLNVDWKFPVHNPYFRREPTSATSSVSAGWPSSSSSSQLTPPVSAVSSSFPPSRSSSPTFGGLPMLSIPSPLTPPSTLPPSPDLDLLSPDMLSPNAFSPASSLPSMRSPVTPLILSLEPFPDYEAEDGDSDDEFPDFSQSPYSDHATGMGVRALLRRSSPPLRVLEMDYADMRTKDFRWLFARVPSLEEFRIVASDMADRVVRLLAPQGARGEVVLPRMRSLELVNCHRLSGEAILEAVKGRVIVTDAAARAGVSEPVPLEDVAIVGCNNFLPEHGEELQELLGDRLRL